MLLSVNSTYDARNELAELVAAKNWLISLTTSSPTMGQADDSIIGTAELTRSHVRFSKYQAMLLFGNCDNLPSLADVGVDGLSGRECVSKLFEDTPITYSRNAAWYRPELAPWIKYDPTEIKVVMKGGVLEQGILDKKAIGAGATGGLFHLIAGNYGNDSALSVMFNMQQMANESNKFIGFSMGIKDLMLSDEAIEKIHQKESDVLNNSDLITEKLNNGEIIPPIDKTVGEFFEEQQLAALSIYDLFDEIIFTDLNIDINNFLKLVATGSKGKPENFISIVSAIGQKRINGERIREKFGFRRTLVYFRRFDTSPAARGFVGNSYLSGMNSYEYIFDAMDARFSLISKALSTSVTGEQNRKSIKNHESVIVNNYRWAVKNRNIVQISYGEDYLDPSKVHEVRFPTVTCSDSEFQKVYYHSEFKDEFEKLKADREKYRGVYFAMERQNVRYLITDRRKVPVKIPDIVDEFCTEYAKLLKKPTTDVLRKMVAKINAFCDSLPYIFLNQQQERNKMPLSDHLVEACWLTVMLTRSTLHPNALIEKQMIPAILDHVLEKIKIIYLHALIAPGTACGIISAQSFSEPLTQYMLDAHRRAVTGGTSKSGMLETKEILSARATEKLKNPSMLIPLLGHHGSTRAYAQEVANNIEVMKLQQFVLKWQIFFEKFNEPVHPDFKHEKSMITNFILKNKLISPPGDLVNWCIRFVLDKTALILKNMALELIINKLREQYPAFYVVYSPENAREIVIRVYIRNTYFSSRVTLPIMRTLCEKLLDMIIRGVSGIVSTKVIEMLRNKINPDGAIVRAEGAWGIETRGTNLPGILALDEVDKFGVITDAIQETAKIFGIEAARQRIISSLYKIIDICNYRHYMAYADEMTFTGKVTSIESGGLKTREASNVLLRVGFVAPMSTLEEAAIHNLEDNITGITAPLLVGSIPRYGTKMNSYHVNTEFVKQNVQNPEDVISKALL